MQSERGIEGSKARMGWRRLEVRLFTSRVQTPGIASTAADDQASLVSIVKLGHRWDLKVEVLGGEGQGDASDAGPRGGL